MRPIKRTMLSTAANPDQRHFSISLTTKLSTLALFMTLANPITASELSDSDRILVTEFEQQSGIPFEDFFSTIVHQRSQCTIEPDPCQRPMRKLTTSYDLVLSAVEDMPGVEAVNAIEAAVLQVLDDVIVTTGIVPTFQEEFGDYDRGYINLLMVDQRTFKASPETYLRKYILRPEFGDPHIRQVAFRSFVDEQYACIMILKGDDTGNLKYADIWIKNDVSERSMRRCVSEKFFNALGIDQREADNGIVFDWPIADFDVRQGLSPLHLLLLKLLYREEFQPGQSQDETRAEIEVILSGQ